MGGDDKFDDFEPDAEGGTGGGMSAEDQAKIDATGLSADELVAAAKKQEQAQKDAEAARAREAAAKKAADEAAAAKAAGVDPGQVKAIAAGAVKDVLAQERWRERADKAIADGIAGGGKAWAERQPAFILKGLRDEAARRVQEDPKTAAMNDDAYFAHVTKVTAELVKEAAEKSGAGPEQELDARLRGQKEGGASATRATVRPEPRGNTGVEFVHGLRANAPWPTQEDVDAEHQRKLREFDKELAKSQ